MSKITSREREQPCGLGDEKISNLATELALD